MQSDQRKLANSFHFFPGALEATIPAHVAAARRAAAGLRRRDPTVWSADPSRHPEIANRLGWLTSPGFMRESVGRLRAFAETVRRDGITDIVLLGMGGSSLAPEVLRSCAGSAAGWPRFRMLDSTDPAAIAAASTPPATTLYLVSSKSGTTIEPTSLAAHFRRELERGRVSRAASHFVAITDEGTPLATLGRVEGFREVFINPSDIGGRYSALSFFGLVPAALMGQDIEALIEGGMGMLTASFEAGEELSNPAVGLGIAMAAAARAARDKLTLLVPPDLDAFGLWVEQLIAESTGKGGTGIIPIAGEPIGEVDCYGPDRLFVRLAHADSRASGREEALLAALSRNNAPLVTLHLSDPSPLGAEFIRWEIATAIAGSLLGVDPFDEPNVQQAKDATAGLLREYQASGRFDAAAGWRLDQATLTLSQGARRQLDPHRADEFLSLVQEGDYVALLAYLGPDPELARVLQDFRTAVRDRTRAATMFAYGPRYLHSTGQLHKGGPNTGVFVLITATPAADIDIPGQPFSFATLEMAQALGDFASLQAGGRRVLHIHLARPDAAGLRGVLSSLLDRLSQTRAQTS